MANALKIVSGGATPTNIVVYFSEPLDTTNLGKGMGNDPSLPANYTVQLQQPPAGQTLTIASAVYDAINSAAILQLKAAPALTKGQWLSVVGNGISPASDTGTPGTDEFFARVNGDDRTSDITKRATRAAEDAVAYPLLTEQITFPRSGSGPTTGVSSSGGSGSNLGQSAALAVGDVLGWKVSNTDPRGFIGALTQAFTLTDTEGHVESTWNPRTYAIQTDLGGGITGAQASLYTRAKDALDQCLSLLNGLYPLDPDADPEYVKALREMARSQMTEIVKELGVVGLPSVLRINTYFDILIGQHDIPVQFDPDEVKGTLGTVREEYGIAFVGNRFSNSVEDEQDITNFRVISDYMTSLLQSWISNRQYFLLGVKGQSAFLGTQLVLISRQFSVVAETVNEVRFALDSVFIGPSERQTLLLKFDDPNLPAMFIEDMLEEVENLATEEGPRLLQDGGRLSVNNNILPVAKSLRHLVKHARRPNNVRNLPDGYRTVRVQRTLDDLHDQLKELISLSTPVGRDVPPPEDELLVTGINPDTQPYGTGNITVTILGSLFEPGTTVTFDFPTPQAVSPGAGFYSAERMDVPINLTGVPAGDYDVTVSNPDGTTLTEADAFTVTAPAAGVPPPAVPAAPPSKQDLGNLLEKHYPALWDKIKHIF